MSDLRNKLIKLAHENPELRSDLLPLLKEAGCEKMPAGKMRQMCESGGPKGKGKPKEDDESDDKSEEKSEKKSEKKSSLRRGNRKRTPGSFRRPRNQKYKNDPRPGARPPDTYDDVSSGRSAWQWEKHLDAMYQKGFSESDMVQKLVRKWNLSTSEASHLVQRKIETEESEHWNPDKYATKVAKRKTFAQARQEILDYLKQQRFQVNDRLKIPHATAPGGEYRLWFKTQSVYIEAGGGRWNFRSARSMHLDDLRKMTPQKFMKEVESWKKTLGIGQSRGDDYDFGLGPESWADPYDTSDWY